MVAEIRIYVEGGGDHKDTKIELRRGFRQFFEPLYRIAQTKRVAFNLVVGGGRDRCFDLFASAIALHQSACCYLLIDSEGPVLKPMTGCLPDRDRWNALHLPVERCHLMVQAMEAWLIADVGALTRYYGAGFNRSALPADLTDVETIPKERLVDGLEHATRHTKKGRYHKTRHAPDLLGGLDSQVVRKASAHCDRLFKVIGDWIDKQG